MNWTKSSAATAFCLVCGIYGQAVAQVPPSQVPATQCLSGTRPEGGGQNSLACGLLSSASGANSSTFGHSSVATATDATALGTASSASGAAATAVGASASASAANSVAIGAGSTASAASTVSVGSAGSERRIVNVAAGLSATDVANVGQVAQVNARVDALDNRVTAVTQQLNRQIASSTAVAAALSGNAFLPDMHFNLTGNVSTYDGAQAGAIQFGALISRHVALNAGVAKGFNKEGKTAGRVGFTFGW